MASEFHQLFIKEVKRRLIDEGKSRLVTCLGILSQEEIWHRPNANSNSIGNLVLHLCGNVRQWLISGLGGAPDTRQRQLEFDEKGPIPTETLLHLLDNTLSEAEAFLDRLTDEDLTRPVTIQGFDETGISVLVHVVEHFSYHVGQVTYYVKLTKDRQTNYYEGLDLDVTN
ncbi:MAG: hypothetical protein Kow0027_30100 [Saprospiraceae bacterium]